METDPRLIDSSHFVNLQANPGKTLRRFIAKLTSLMQINTATKATVAK